MTKQEHIDAAEQALAQENEIALDSSRVQLADRLLKRAQVHSALALAKPV